MEETDSRRRVLQETKGIQSRAVIERTGKETQRGEDTRIKRGRKCLVMLGWARAAGFPSQAVWVIHSFSGSSFSTSSEYIKDESPLKQCSMPNKQDDKHHPSHRHRAITHFKYPLQMLLSCTTEAKKQESCNQLLWDQREVSLLEA